MSWHRLQVHQKQRQTQRSRCRLPAAQRQLPAGCARRALPFAPLRRPGRLPQRRGRRARLHAAGRRLRAARLAQGGAMPRGNGLPARLSQPQRSERVGCQRSAAQRRADALRVLRQGPRRRPMPSDSDSPVPFPGGLAGFRRARSGAPASCTHPWRPAACPASRAPETPPPVARARMRQAGCAAAAATQALVQIRIRIRIRPLRPAAPAAPAAARPRRQAAPGPARPRAAGLQAGWDADQPRVGLVPVAHKPRTEWVSGAWQTAGQRGWLGAAPCTAGASMPEGVGSSGGGRSQMAQRTLQ